jgi:hypothetical protein
MCAQIATLTIMHAPANGVELTLSEDQLYQTRQAIKNVFATIYVYLAIHSYIKVDQLKRANRLQHLPPSISLPHMPASQSKVSVTHLL